MSSIVLDGMAVHRLAEIVTNLLAGWVNEMLSS
jgi:hypothetical protein